MKNNNHGGKRKKAGRKPMDDKCIPIRIFPKESKVELLGGEEEVKNKLMKYIERTAVRAVRQKNPIKSKINNSKSRLH